MLSYGVAYKKLQSMLLESPWFMKHGKVYGRDDKNKWYLPDKGIEFTVGSQERHSLGQDIFCLTGDTIIMTPDGEKCIEDLDGQSIYVLSEDNNGNIRNSNKCHVIKTGTVNDIYIITLEDGTTIKATGSHLMRLSSGIYCRVDALKVGDDLKSLKN
jgi:hypothetical protein